MPRRLDTLPSPPGLPFLGNALQIRPGHLHLTLERWARQYGPFYTVRLGGYRILMVSDEPAIQQALRERPAHYRRVSRFEGVFKELGGHGVFSAEGAEWIRQRKLIMTAFTTDQQRELCPKIAPIVARLQQLWSGAAARGDTVDVRRDVMRFTVDVTAQLVFGRDLGTIDNPDAVLQHHLSRVFQTILRRVNAVVPYWRYFKLPRDHAVDKSLRVVHQLILELMAEATASLAHDSTRAPRTLLEALLAAQFAEAPDRRLSQSEVSANVLLLLLAGEDTTADTITSMIHHVAQERHLQARLHDESRSFFLGATDPVLRFEDVARLPYAVAVAKETLRLRSAVPVAFLESVADRELGDVAVPAGTPVFLLTRFLALSAENFFDAGAFRPERWLPCNDELGAHNPRVSLAFGAGPRVCPGRSLALFECVAVLSMLVRNFELEAVRSERVEELLEFTMQLKGVRVRFTRRTPSHN